MNSEIMQYYRLMEKNIKINKNNEFSLHVNPTLTQLSPIHNWYHFKEAYSPELLNKIINYTNQDNINIFDPFCGSGTTLLSAALNTDKYVNFGLGIEVNPFIHFVAKTKLNFYRLNIGKVEKFLLHLTSKNIYLESNKKDIPELSTIKRAFTQSTLNQLMNLKNEIKDYFDNSGYEIDFLLLGFASILEITSCMKKSGRALKVNEKLYKDYDVKSIFINKIKNMIEDVKNFKKLDRIPILNTLNQDIRSISLNCKEKFNLVVFSPPYLNHFDYTEIYKIELWMLDFIRNSEEFRSLRYKTLRSHPSIKFQQTEIYKTFNSKNINGYISVLNKSEKQEQFYYTIRGYIDDMYRTFSHISNLTSTNSYIFCVVANSLFGSNEKGNFTPVATDLIISEIARDIGFDLIEIIQARKVTRRGLCFPYNRESIIIMKKEKIFNSSIEFIDMAE